jgi:hypothetical protein
MEAAALRQQLAVYKRKQPRPKLSRFDRLFWVVVRRIWTNWSEALILVKPDPVVCWHRAGYRLFWRWRSRRQGVGRPKVAEEVRDLIRRMERENPTWAPRIHGELLLLGFEISEPTVSRYLRRLKRIPEERKASQWLAFLNNYREVIAAFDFFTVPTLWFRTLYSSLRLNTIAGAFCTLTLPSIQQASGSCSNCGKHSRFPAPINTCCSTMMPSSEMTSFNSFDPVISRLFAPVSGTRGRMEPRNVGSAARVKSCSTMLFRETNLIFGSLGALTLPTIMQTRPTLP